MTMTMTMVPPDCRLLRTFLTQLADTASDIKPKIVEWYPYKGSVLKPVLPLCLIG